MIARVWLAGGLISATCFGGCIIYDHRDHDDDGFDGTYHCIGDECFSEGSLSPEGSYCETNFDCDYGLICDVPTSACAPEPTTCSENIQCGPGCYCDESSCLPSPLCSDDLDCGEGFICDPAYGTCVPGVVTCNDIEAEQECADRSDCEPVYAGVNCSCGPDCTCLGGEPNCVCESFEFFTCAELL